MYASSPIYSFTGYSCVSDSPFHKVTPQPLSSYTEAAPVELDMHNWFFGNITEEQATVELSGSNGFLVRHTSNTLILSTRMRGWRKDYVIDHSPEGYWLKEIGQIFKSVPQLIEHYQKFPIEEQQVLGVVSDRTASGNSIVLMDCLSGTQNPRIGPFPPSRPGAKIHPYFCKNDICTPVLPDHIYFLPSHYIG
jgi:hypothetical protein